MRNRTYVLGCGKLGAAVANDASRKGLDVVVIDANKDSFAQLDDNFSGYPINADATDLEALAEAGIQTAKEVIIAVGNDNASLFLAHACAKLFEIPYVYVRFDDPAMGLLIQGMNIKAIYPFQLSKERFGKLKVGAEGQ